MARTLSRYEAATAVACVRVIAAALRMESDDSRLNIDTTQMPITTIAMISSMECHAVLLMPHHCMLTRPVSRPELTGISI